MNVDLQNEIIADLTVELQDEPTFNLDILEIKVKNAIREVMMKRNYQASSYTAEQVENDLKNYYSVIKSLALYDYNQIGVEGESSHSENSISRSWINRDELLNGIHAFIKFI